MVLGEPVHVNAESEVFRRLKQPRFEFFLQQQRVGAQVYVLAARDQPLDNFLDLRVQQRLAARDRHHWCAAFLDGVETLPRGELALQNMGGILDLSAAGAGQIAAKERLKHQNQRVAPAATQFLAEHIARYGPHLAERHAHGNLGEG